MASSLFESSHPGLPSGERITITVGGGILLLPLLLIPHGSGGLTVRRAHVPAGSAAAAATNGAAAALPEVEQPLLGGPQALQSAATAVSRAELSAAMPCLSPRQCLSSPEFWLLFACCVAGMGSGLVLTNNLAQYWLSLGGAPDGHTIFLRQVALRAGVFFCFLWRGVQDLGQEGVARHATRAGQVRQKTGADNTALIVDLPHRSAPLRSLRSLFSITNTAGRMAMGWLPESMLHAFGTPRPVFLVVAALACAGTCLGLALATAPPLLYPLSMAMGFCFGSFWSLMPSLASELFGLPVGVAARAPVRHACSFCRPAQHALPWRPHPCRLPPPPSQNFASNYTLLQLAPAIGSFGLSLALVSFFYQRALTRHGGGGSTCIGADCFRPTWATLATLGLLGSAAALALFLRTRKAYRRVHAAARQADEDLCRLRPHRASPLYVDDEEQSLSPGSTRPPSPPPAPPPLLVATVAAAMDQGLDSNAA